MTTNCVIKIVALQIFRLGLLFVLAWLLREHALQLRVQGEKPISLTEVREFLPEAMFFDADPGVRGGLIVRDGGRETIGYAVRTMPMTREIVGYSGPIDVLVVFDHTDAVLGTAIRQSYDTPSHVEDVEKDYLFMEAWNGKSWNEVAKIEDFGDADIYAVSGASRTSEAMMQSITARLALNEVVSESSFQWRWQDTALSLIVALGCAFAFIKKRGFQMWQPLYRVAVFVVLGFVLGDLLAQSLFIGWVESRVPWRETPGVVLLAVAAFLIPATTRQPLYCQYICPHGHAQRWLMKYVPAKWLVKLEDDSKWSLKWLPPLLLGLVLVMTILQLPLDLAGIEPFDAYLINSAGTATIVVAIVGLVVSAFVPMAYCKYGCPTGWLFSFVRRTTKNRFSRQDAIALVLVVIAFGLIKFYEPLQRLIAG